MIAASSRFLPTSGVTSGGSSSAGSRTKTLPSAVIHYRAADDTELQNILQVNAYEVVTGQVEGKYFYPTIVQAQRLCSLGWATTVTSATFPAAVLAEATRLYLPHQGDSLYLPPHVFSHGPVAIHDPEPN